MLCKREFYIADSNVSGKDGCVIVLDARLITQIVVVQQHPAGMVVVKGGVQIDNIAGLVM